MKKIGAVLFGNKSLEVREFPDLEPGLNEVLIEVKAAGICGSDLHFYRSSPEELGARYGKIVGHEPAGIVVQTGDAVSKFKVGDRVTVNHTLGCGHCQYCHQGETVLCPTGKGMALADAGANTNVLKLPENTCLELPENISFEDGTFIACTGATAYNAVQQLRGQAVRNVVVFGLGPVGLSAILLLEKMGINAVGIDPIKSRRDFASSLGCKKIGDFTETEGLIKLSPNREGFCASIETSGASNAQSQAIDVLRPKGIAIYLGLSKGVPSISPEQFIHKQIRLQGSKVLPSWAAVEMMNFMQESNFSFEQLIREKIPLHRAAEAFEMFESGMSGKFILLPN